MRRNLLSAGAALAAVLASTAPVAAQGSAVMTHGSCATAMGAAGVAAPCEDGSAVLFNPAALAQQSSVIGVGWTGIASSGSFTFDQTLERFERESSTSSVPFGYASYRFSDRLAAGIGVFALYGLGLTWDDDDDIEFEGRFTSYDTDLSNIYIQPTLSFAVSPRFSVGAGVDFIRSALEINQRVDLATIQTPRPGVTFGQLGVPLGTDFADAELAGDGSAVTFHLGALAQISETFSVGARYLHGAEIDLEGDADFTQIATNIRLNPGNPLGAPAGTPLDVLLQPQFAAGALLGDQTLSTSLAVPAQLVVGVGFTPLAALRLRADYQWTNWESFDEAEILFADQPLPTTLVLDYQNTSTYRLGGEFGASDALTLRAGFIYNTAAQREFSVSPLLPEAERNYYSVGLGYAFGDALQLDVGYQLVDQSDRRGRVRPRPVTLTDETALRALNVGVFSNEAHVFNVTLSSRFGSRR